MKRRRSGRAWAAIAWVAVGGLVAARAPGMAAADGGPPTTTDAPAAEGVPASEELLAADVLPVGHAPGPRQPVVLSGAASVGAYEAGWLYVVLEAVKRHPDVVDLRLVTGTSAGGINALLAVLAACSAPEDRPEESPFWRIWIPIGFDDLYRAEAVTATSVFTDDALRRAAAGIGEDWSAGIAADCDVVMGVTATRLEPISVSLTGSLDAVPRTEEKFVVRVRGRGPWSPPVAENYPPTNPGVPVPLLPLEPPDEAFGVLRDLVLASAAYPIAFPPVMLPHCLYDGSGPPVCTREDATAAAFLDGGFFDNRPLRLAVNVATEGLEPDPAVPGGVRWADTRVVEPGDVADGVLFLVLDPWARAFPDPPSPLDDDGDATLLGLVRRLLGTFVDASRAKEIQTVFEERPSVRGRIVPSQTRFPLASTPLGAFLGFFERSFREADFHLGMHDAYAQLARARPRLLAAGYEADGFDAPPAVAAEGLGGWDAYRCVAATLDERPGRAEACAGPALRPLRILLQVAVERLHERCAEAAEREPPIPPPVAHPRCEAAQRGEPPPRWVPLVGDAPDETWRRLPGEGALDHALRRLAAHGFPFEDLGLEPGDAHLAPARIRDRLQAVVDGLSEAQGVDGMVVRAVGEQALGEIAYVPDPSIGHVVLGPVVEAGWSGTAPLGSVPWLRASVALRFEGLGTLLSSREAYFAVAPLGGVEVELLPLSSSTVQPRLGVRAGYLFSTADGFLTGDCDADARSSGDARCSRFQTQAYVAASLWGVVRLQVEATVEPPLRQAERTVWAVHPGIGVQF